MSKHYLVTGGAGFIGTNYVARLLRRNERVTIYDNLSRVGCPRNIKWLNDTFGKDAYCSVVGDVRDSKLLVDIVGDVDVIVHLAGQVAVTSSVKQPREDFECNAIGTFNVLEAARLSGRHPVVLYASTNKVYGGMEDIQIVEAETRYQYADYPWGVPETYPLNFHSPYGCSKGAGDQYMRDYYRIYGLPTVVLRQSCIYGPRQFGIEDQGWVAWLVIASITNRSITIFGDGKQVRDVLYVDDLLNAYDAAIAQIDRSAGQIYNIGGGPANTISIWREFGPILTSILSQEIPIAEIDQASSGQANSFQTNYGKANYGDWRPGDQRVYISDIRKAERELDWTPQVSVENGIRRLVSWIQENRFLF